MPQEYGLQFIYHNHNFEFVRFAAKTGLDILLENTEPWEFKKYGTLRNLNTG